MNREQKRAMQKAGQVGADGAPTAAPRDRRAAAQQRVQGERTKPLEFVREVRAEMRKVSWPNRQEVIRYSIIVLVALAVFTALVFVLDIAFGDLFKNLFDTGTKSTPAALGVLGVVGF
ncbi:MAG: preprotein translocase subunit SecE [Actinomycetes bacterium]